MKKFTERGEVSLLQELASSNPLEPEARGYNFEKCSKMPLGGSWNMQLKGLTHCKCNHLNPIKSQENVKKILLILHVLDVFSFKLVVSFVLSQAPYLNTSLEILHYVIKPNCSLCAVLSLDNFLSEKLVCRLIDNIWVPSHCVPRPSTHQRSYKKKRKKYSGS